MRLRSLILQNYGVFKDVRLTLDPAPGRINLLAAPNGAGKTILRQAFRDLLFGISTQSPMGFRFGYKGMRLMAEANSVNGERVAFGRRKGAGNTLLDVAGAALDGHSLAHLIGSADGLVFDRLFALDTRLLREGAEAMLDSGGDLAEALFAAGSSISAVRRIRTTFETLRDELAPARKGRTPFYQALEQWLTARTEARTTAVRPQAWDDLVAAIDDASKRRRLLTTTASEITVHIERLQRVKRVRPWLEQRATAYSDLAAVADAPSLPADIDPRWQSAVQAAERARFHHGKAEERLVVLTNQLAAEEFDGVILAEAVRIDVLIREQGQIDSDRRDLPKREAEHRGLADRLADLLSDLGYTAESVLPNTPCLATARDLIRRHAVIAERLQTAEAAAARSATDRDAANACRAQMPEVQDIAALAALVADAQALGDPSRVLTEAQQRLAREEARLTAALGKVPIWKGTNEAIGALVPPARPTVDRHAKAIEAAQLPLTTAERELAQSRKARDAAVAELAKLRKGKPVPDEAAVAAARAHRDKGWSLIWRTKFDGKSATADVAAYAGQTGLAAAYEQAVEAADRVADRRDAESQRLAAIAEQQSRIEICDRDVAAAEGAVAITTKKVADATRAWTALVKPLGLPETVTVGELREFLTAREAVLDRRTARDEARNAFEAETHRQETWRKRFAKLLPAGSCASLAESLSAAQARLAAADKAKSDRMRLEERIDTLVSLDRQATAAVRSANAERGAWQAEWQRCLARLNGPPDATPAAVEKTVALIEEARATHTAIAELDRRMAGMRRNIATFEEGIRALSARIAPDLMALPGDSAVSALQNRLATARQVETRLAMLTKDEAAARAALGQARQALDAADAELQVLRSLVGGASDDETVERIAQARRQLDAETRVRSSEAKLLELGDGLPIDTLEREAGTVDPAAVEAELSRVQDESERLGREREAAAQAEANLLHQRGAMSAAQPALDAAQRAQSAAASLSRTASEALAYHTAACLLQTALQRLRGDADDGLVPRIGTAYARITGGAYAGVVTEEDAAGRPYLVALEADGATRKRVDQLSEGFRDQLFLALRLVMIGDYATTAPPLPFIADDLLQTFDDERTAHALRALVELSATTQVIVLTHHRHLLEIAGTLPAESVHVCELAA